MGAADFIDEAVGKTAKEAFKRAVEDALWEHGHGGYTGTIAEKGEFKLIGTAKTLEDACEQAEALIIAGDPRIDDKWGPAGCIEVETPPKGAKKGEKTFVFFGWASA